MDPAPVNLEHTETGRRRRRRVGARVVKEKKRKFKADKPCNLFYLLFVFRFGLKIKEDL